jgi:RNA polymerase-binding transcription factor DksA
VSDDDRPDLPTDGDELEVDVASFLPEGVELADASLDEASGDEPSAPPVDEPSAPPIDEEPSAPPVDLEALSQIERDLDAVDAAIAALDAGTYGIDPTSGEPIDDALLAADPTRLS